LALRGKLLSNSAVTIIAVLIISIAALTGIYKVRQRVFDVTESSTPGQLKTVEFTKTLQEHATLLSLTTGVSTESEVSENERELGRTLAELRGIASQPGSLKALRSISTVEETVGEVEALTRQIVLSTRERVRAQSRAARSLEEAQELIRLNVRHRMTLQSSLKQLQADSISGLLSSSSKTKEMATQFRMLQGARESLQQLATAVDDLRTASEVHEVAVIQSRGASALGELKRSAKDATHVVRSLASFEALALDSQGPFSLKFAHLTNPTPSNQNLFRESWTLCRMRLDEISRLITDSSEDATAAFYSQNSQLDRKVADSDAVGKAMLLNTELSTRADAIQSAIETLVREPDPDRIHASGSSIGTLFTTTRDITVMMERTLSITGRVEEQNLIHETGAALDRVEKLVLNEGHVVETLEAAARTRIHCDLLARKLVGMINAQNENSRSSIREAHEEQKRTVGTVNRVVKAVMALLLGAIVFVLGIAALLDRRIRHSIMDLVRDLESAKEGAEAASKAKSQFLANMSHEIRTPMNGVLGLLELLKASNLKEKQRHYVNTALSSSVALLNVINDILDFSKMEAGRMDLVMEEFDLLQTAEDAAALFSEQADAKNIELLCHVSLDIPKRLRGDPTRLRQVLINLIGNAVKFTESGEVVLKIHPIAIQDASATLRFTVSDTGIGIPAEVQAQIFQSFFQADLSTTRKFGGTGLGLTIATQLVRLMGGEIGVDSEHNKGSTFWFTARFDIPDTTPAVEATSERQSPRKELKGLRVLVVDDNATNRGILNEMLLAWGFAPESATNGPEALRMLEEAHSEGMQFQLAILDMMMPGMSGIELARVMRGNIHCTNVRLIMLTSLDGPGDMELARQFGIAAYLVKPVRQSWLMNAVTSAMGIEAVNTHPPDRRTSCRFSSASVLLVEDHPVNQEVGKAMLELLGCMVDVAANGRIALELCSHAVYDLILMDCQMPEMDGYAATRAIRSMEMVQADARHTPIVALTAHALEGDREKSLEAGMDEHLSKPFTLEELTEVLAKYLPFECVGVQMVAQPVATEERQDQHPDGRPDAAVASGIDRVVLDRIRAIEAQGSARLLETVVTYYVKESPGIFTSLLTAVEANDAGAMQELAHSLKSASANIGAKKMADLCKEMEAAARNGATQRGHDLLLQMEREFDLASKALMAEL
jgi:two-component system, sensor histidine kinase and response regulator